jgi:cytoskeleton protein RodZ
MKKTGQLLKDKRESANLSLSEVALATKINPKILAAIEDGDQSRLPAMTFLKGFVRSYALFLKMDVEEVLRTFQEETGVPTPTQKSQDPQRVETVPAPNTTTSRRRVTEENSSGLRTAAVVVIVLLIGMIIGVRELIEKYQREKQTVNPDSIKVSPLLQPPAESVVAKPDETQSLTNNSAPVATPMPEVAPVVESKKPEKSKSEEPAKPAPPPEAVKAVVKNEPPPSPPKPPPPPPPAPVKETKPATPEASAAAPAAEAPKPAKVGKNEIILEALDKVDVVMRIKGETKKISLNATQVHTIHVDQPVVFDFSDGGAVNIILNGHERGVPGDLGKPKQVTIP